MERLTRPVEIRAEGRNVAGTVIPYGDVSPTHRERFEPGSLILAESVPLNVHHESMAAVAWLPDGGLELADGDAEMSMRATLAPIPAGDYALEEIRAGRIVGLSLEFRCRQDRRENGIRVVEKALLTGIGLVRSPSYAGSRVEARSRKHGRFARWL